MRTEEEMVAYALEVAPELLPFIPELLADLDELGCDSDSIVELIASLALPQTACVLDLGCGKGVVPITIAKEIGLRVIGVDLFAPFIESCKETAKAEGVSDLCTFRCGNILKLVDTLEPVDIVVYAALGDVLGPLDKTIEIIRKFVKPGGYLIINDDFVKEGKTPSYEGFESSVSYKETRKRLESSGDVIVKEVIESIEEMIQEDIENNANIRRRAEALSILHPELKEAFLEFAESQEEECDFLAENMIPATWLIKRT